MKALWLGRFQPPTIAHHAALRAIHEQYSEVVIGVIYDTPRPKVARKWRSVLDEEDRGSYTKGKNPFTPTEVIEMWNAVITTDHLRASCRAIQRPQFFDFNKKFPVELYRLVSTGHRSDVHQALFGRVVHQIEPPFELHNTYIRELIGTGRKWQEFIPAGMWKVFEQLNGVARM